MKLFKTIDTDPSKSSAGVRIGREVMLATRLYPVEFMIKPAVVIVGGTDAIEGSLGKHLLVQGDGRG